ncbi:hypothetical protein O1611_g5783 [Lasiodiplodia mahajangana]|uniref:Uncharacterized protein n=1 Tax=Lasiodiplodia mahajangana TaxID=1108764 RepID=A0ACC2JKX3_9PEZI|nr:hypothetical protein O1611_g5783 [Lasiodiplodia mahajangana]
MTPQHRINLPAKPLKAIRNPSTPLVKDASSQPKSPPSEPARLYTLKDGLVNESESSSGSAETVTVAPVTKGIAAKPRKHHFGKPNALNFLDPDSPQVTSESIQRTVKEATKQSPNAGKSTSPSSHSISSTSSGFREDLFDAYGDHETDQGTSPEHSIDGDSGGRVLGNNGPRPRVGKSRKRSYGTPEMARANIQHSHIPADDLTPRAPNQHFSKPPLRAEKLPLTGYELLASKLSATSIERNGIPLRPIYRRFEALNHRILLHLQDEICELEDQLHQIDTADTQNRRLPTGILPASRRAEYLSNNELQWHKNDVIWKIAFKLDQYNRVLSSFRQTFSLSPPTTADMQEYRGFLDNYAPISDAETRFLDATDDLICLGDSDGDMTADEEDLPTPVSRSDIAEFHPRRRVSIISQSDISRRFDDRVTTPSVDPEIPSQDQHRIAKHALMLLSVAMAVAVILPILTFLVIPGFIGRMTVVCLVGIGILGALVQAKVIKLQATQEFCVSVGLYGGVMAILAGMGDENNEMKPYLPGSTLLILPYNIKEIATVPSSPRATITQDVPAHPIEARDLGEPLALLVHSGDVPHHPLPDQNLIIKADIDGLPMNYAEDSNTNLAFLGHYALG